MVKVTGSEERTCCQMRVYSLYSLSSISWYCIWEEERPTTDCNLQTGGNRHFDLAA